MRLGFFLREAMRAMRRNAAPSFAALATVLVTMLVLGVFIPIVQATKGAANSVRGRVLVDVYMYPSATATDDARVRTKLLAVQHVKSVEFVSKEQAYRQQSKQDPQAYLLIANTIRLSLYARRREVEVMKLVGATDWFIRWPFVIEGTVVGAIGALLAIAVLGVTKIALLDPLANNWTLIAAPRTLPFTALVAVLLGAGVLVSALGSGLSLRRFLRV